MERKMTKICASKDKRMTASSPRIRIQRQWIEQYITGGMVGRCLCLWIACINLKN